MALNRKPGPALHSVIRAIRRIPAARRDGGEEDAQQQGLGVVTVSNEGQQVLGTCSPVHDHVSLTAVLDTLEEIREQCITGPEAEAVRRCERALITLPTYAGCES